MVLRRIIVGVAILSLLFCQTYLLRAQSSVFASPDETAVKVAISQIKRYDRANFFDVDPFQPLYSLSRLVHPRSWVSVGQSFAPIGFLGLPYFLARVSAVGFSPELAAMMLIISGALAFFLLLRERFSVRASLLGVFVVYTFPVVLLYTNRYYFSHLPQIACLFWCWYFSLKSNYFTHKKFLYFLLSLLSGFLFSAAFSFRWSEWFWLIFFTGYFFYSLKIKDWKWWIVWMIGFLVYAIPFLSVNETTYSEYFNSVITVGYLIREPAFELASPNTSSTTSSLSLVSSASSSYSIIQFIQAALFPYGFHPRHIFYNFYRFWIVFLWPWMFFIVFSLALLFYTRILRFIKTGIILAEKNISWLRGFLLSAPFFLLLLIYGSGFYADHLQPGYIGLGNSFLRYLIPFYFLIGLLVAFTHTHLKGAYMHGFEVLCILFCVLGVVFAFYRTNESLFSLNQELVRYQFIREKTSDYFQSKDIILSPRSDKIFFPLFRVISPMPNLFFLRPLARECQCSLGLFDRALSEEQIAHFRELGFSVQLLEVFGNESLYRLILL